MMMGRTFFSVSRGYGVERMGDYALVESGDTQKRRFRSSDLGEREREREMVTNCAGLARLMPMPFGFNFSFLVAVKNS